MKFPFFPSITHDGDPFEIARARLADLSWLTQEGWLAQEGGNGGDFLTGLLNNPLILPVGLLLIFYLTFIAPERRRRAEESKTMSALKKNDRVVTIGGIHGTVVSVAPESDVVTLRIDESSNTRIKLNRSAIAKIVTANKEKETNKEVKSKAPEPESSSSPGTPSS